MVTVFCKVCNKEFRTKSWYLQRGWSKYCSKNCRNESQKKGRFVKCGICEKKIWRSPRSFKHSKSGEFFCTKSCQTQWRNKIYSGSNHVFWIDGSSVYRKKLLESRVVVICRLCNEKDKRILQVHHIDNNKQNNEIDNLVWVCLNCHHLIHRCGVLLI